MVKVGEIEQGRQVMGKEKGRVVRRLDRVACLKSLVKQGRAECANVRDEVWTRG